MKKILLILLLSPLFGFTQTDWQTTILNVRLAGVTDTFLIDVEYVNSNDKGYGEPGNYLIDNVSRVFKVIDYDVNSYDEVIEVTVVDLEYKNEAPQGNLSAKIYVSIVGGDTTFSSIGSIDNSMLDELSKWRMVARDNEIFGQVITTKATYPILADSVNLDTLYGATYNSVQDWSNNTQSAGIIEGGMITDGGSGTVDISLLSGILKTTDSEIGENVYFDLAATTGQTLTDETTNYISVNYNSGTPTLIATTTNTANGHTIIPLGRAFREGTSVDIINSGVRLYDFSKRVQQHHIEEAMLHFVSGAAVSEVGTRNITITAGVLYAGLNRILTDEINTSTGDDFEYYYYNGTVWIESDQTQIDNIYYNDITSGLVELTPNRYVEAWVYKGDGDKSYMLYGQGDHTEAQAIEARRPSTLPDHIENFGVIRAKIIIKKSATTFFSLEQIGEGEYTSTAVNDHNELTGLNVAPYLHLTTDEYIALDTITANASDIVKLKAEQITQNTAIDLNTAKTGITTAQSNAIIANTGKDTTGIYHTNRTALDAVSGTNTGDQDISGITTNAEEIETRVNYSDSITTYVTPTQLYDSISALSLLTASYSQSRFLDVDSGLTTVFLDIDFADSLYLVLATGTVSSYESTQIYVTEQYDDRFNIYVTSDCTLKYNALGNTPNLSDPNIIPLGIAVGGYFDFSWNGGGTWYFPDGSTRTETRPSRTLTEGGTVYLVADAVGGNYQLVDNNTNSDFIGTTRDLANLTYFASFGNCTLLTGDILNLANLTYYASFYNCTLLTGDILNLANLTYYANFYNCPLLTGDILNLANLTYYANFGNCPLLTGDILNLANLTYYADFTNCSILTGDILNLANLTYYVSFYNCSLLTGDILNLANLTYYANFGNCPLLTLSVAFEFKVTRAYFQDCSLSELEVQYLLESLVLGGKSNGTCNVSGTNAGANTAALAAIATLGGLGWTITYNTL